MAPLKIETHNLSLKLKSVTDFDYFKGQLNQLNSLNPNSRVMTVVYNHMIQIKMLISVDYLTDGLFHGKHFPLLSQLAFPSGSKSLSADAGQHGSGKDYP